jgi:two-component sensor histidine kinase
MSISGGRSEGRLRLALAQQPALLRDANHRVKSNLGVVNAGLATGVAR